MELEGYVCRARDLQSSTRYIICFAVLISLTSNTGFGIPIRLFKLLVPVCPQPLPRSPEEYIAQLYRGNTIFFIYQSKLLFCLDTVRALHSLACEYLDRSSYPCGATTLPGKLLTTRLRRGRETGQNSMLSKQCFIDFCFTMYGRAPAISYVCLQHLFFRIANSLWPARSRRE